jgi:hypothetical protein
MRRSELGVSAVGSYYRNSIMGVSERGSLMNSEYGFSERGSVKNSMAGSVYASSEIMDDEYEFGTTVKKS